MIWQDNKSKSAKRKEFCRTLELITTGDSGESMKPVEKRERSYLLRGQDEKWSELRDISSQAVLRLA